MRPIQMNNNLIDQILDEFRIQLKDHKAVTNRVSYSKTLTELYPKAETEEKVKVIFTLEAYQKMMQLTYTCSDEVGWHGTVTRLGAKEFLIDDILVFPQIVTGASVDPDEEEFGLWMTQLMMKEDDEDIEIINRLRFHGHSHVRMHTSPSAKDDQYQLDMLTKIRDYYIFLITNKDSKHNIMIYDVEENVYYDKDDIVIKIQLQDGSSLSTWVSDKLSLVRREPTVRASQTVVTPATETVIVKAPAKEAQVRYDTRLRLYVTEYPDGSIKHSVKEPKPKSKGGKK